MDSDVKWLRDKAADAHREIESMFHQARLDASRIIDPRATAATAGEQTAGPDPANAGS